MHIAAAALATATDAPPEMAEAILAEAMQEPARPATLAELIAVHQRASAEHDRLTADYSQAERHFRAIPRPGAPQRSRQTVRLPDVTVCFDGRRPQVIKGGDHTYTSVHEVEASTMLTPEQKAAVLPAVKEFEADIERIDAETGWSTAKAAVEVAAAASDQAAERSHVAFRAILAGYQPPTLADFSTQVAYLFEVADDLLGDTDPRPLLQHVLRLANADAHLMSLAPELERCLDQEREQNGREPACTDAELDAAAAETARVTRRILSLEARTVDGLRLQARAIAAGFNSTGDCTDFGDGPHDRSAHGEADRFFARLIRGAPPVSAVSPGAMTLAQEQAETTAMYEAAEADGSMEVDGGAAGQGVVWDRFLAAPILHPADAAEKLKFIAYSMENGETAYDAPLLQQVIAYLQATPERTLYADGPAMQTMVLRAAVHAGVEDVDQIEAAQTRIALAPGRALADAMPLIASVAERFWRLYDASGAEAEPCYRRDFHEAVTGADEAIRLVSVSSGVDPEAVGVSTIMPEALRDAARKAVAA